MENLIKPFITINGATRQSHIDARIEAMRAVRDAMKALCELRPHARDYQGHTDAYERDRIIHSARFAALDTLHNTLEIEALAIMNEE
jgi:hypothetical protein